jgi:DNA-binding transcriptional ArsR family regulator
MNSTVAMAALAGLAQETRLAAFRLLVERGPAGLTPGRIADALDVPAATLSFHLKELARAGLINARQESRFIYYSANFKVMNDLVAYLTENCCADGGCGPSCRPGYKPRLPRGAKSPIVSNRRRAA